MITAAEEAVGKPDIAGLVRGAADGDLGAWERLVAQFARLIWSITSEFKLAESDAADVAQTTWLRLLEHIDRIDQSQRDAGKPEPVLVERIERRRHDGADEHHRELDGDDRERDRTAAPAIGFRVCQNG